MSRTNGLTKFITAGFFLLAVTGFVAYRSGWLHPDTPSRVLEETPEVPVVTKQVEEVSESINTEQGLNKEIKPSPNKISMDLADSFSSGNDSLVIIENDIMRKNINDPNRKNILQKEEPVMFSGSKSGYIIKPAEFVPLKIVFDSIFKPAKPKQ